MWKIAPENELVEIEQNIRMILRTPKGSVPLHRDFGISYDFLDLPLNKAIVVLRNEIVKSIRRWERRVEIEEVKVEPSEGGALQVKIIWRSENGRGEVVERVSS